MSFDFDKRWEAGHRAGRVHPFEKSRILGGDYGPIIRELEPAFEEGEKHVLSQTRPRGSLHRDRLTGIETVYPKPPPSDLFWIEVRDVVRHRAGHWRVRFHVYDRRQVVLRVRRKPPVFSRGKEEEEAIDDAQVAIDSAYTTNPEQALDQLQSVPPEEQNELVMQAKERWAKHQAEERAEELRKRELRAVTSTIKETATMMARHGLDATVLLVDLQRVVEDYQQQLQEAA